MMEHKVWTQSIRIKMVNAIYRNVVETVRDHWRKQFEKELEKRKKALDKHAKKTVKELYKVMKEHYEGTNKKRFDVACMYMIEDTLEINDIHQEVETKLGNLGIPYVGWMTDNDVSKKATELLQSEVHTLNILGFLLLEFLRTGHLEQWREIGGYMSTYKEEIFKLNNKEDINNV